MRSSLHIRLNWSPRSPSNSTLILNINCLGDRGREGGGVIHAHQQKHARTHADRAESTAIVHTSLLKPTRRRSGTSEARKRTRVYLRAVRRVPAINFTSRHRFTRYNSLTDSYHAVGSLLAIIERRYSNSECGGKKIVQLYTLVSLGLLRGTKSLSYHLQTRLTLGLGMISRLENNCSVDR